MDLTNKNQVMIDTSRYTVDSLMLYLHESLYLGLTLDQTNAGANFTTTSLDAYLPGLVAKFGANQPVTIDIATRDAPLSYMKVGQLGLDITTRLTVKVNA